ncbi:proprotein convertase subtilisin/kexin type 5 [Hypomesus transpacificus]|uniref:proprotein convertase subtilisin/kexin type 5 n=1 Tax=Hypomesus transpacificus TaxID=137520 RepID=UPI001F07FD6C|nr:proprotein convertase subtilisin/kexin type 5 [Hypomesus transpacificus]
MSSSIARLVVLMKTDMSASSTKVTVRHTAPVDSTLTGLTMPACPASPTVSSALMAAFVPNAGNTTGFRMESARQPFVIWAKVQDPETGECLDCELGCKTCSTEDPEICNSCIESFFLQVYLSQSSISSVV